MSVTRRQVIAGFGSTVAAGAFVTAGTVRAAPPDGSGFADNAASVILGGEGSAAITLTPGLAYLSIDPTAFFPYDSADGRNVDLTGASLDTPPGGLMAPVSLPLGSTVREVTLGYLSAAGNLRLGLWRKAFIGNYAVLHDPPSGLPVPNGAAAQTATVNLSEAVDGQSSYMVLIEGISTVAQRVHGVVVGYTPPPQAFVPISPVTRVLDTRIAGGKLNLNEERTVALGLPVTARAAVVNLTIVDTEGQGFVAVFPANIAYPGNSSINWAAPGTVIANGVISAVDPTGSVKIRCGGNGRTHVIIDVQGYLL